MKKISRLTCFIAGAAIAGSAQAGDVTGRSFFSVRPHYQSASPERVSFFRNDLLSIYKDEVAAAQIVIYGSRSTSPHLLARYFMPPTCTNNLNEPGLNNCCFNVSEFNATSTTPDGFRGNDVEARHFNIRTNAGTFKSTVCFEPREEVIGIGLTYRHYLSDKCNDSLGVWFEISTAIERIKHVMNLRETIHDNGGGPVAALGLDNSPFVANMTAAFKQPSWKYGRIDDCRCDARTGLADIELKFGWNTLDCENYYLGSYFGLVVPAGSRIRSNKVFEPIVGNGHHFGIMFGNSVGFDICEFDCGATLSWRFDSDSRYLFPNHQPRSLDLVGKPWSRYMETYRNQSDALSAANLVPPSSNLALAENAGTSGINVFTRCVRVKPHAQFQATNAFLIEQDMACGTALVELGLNLFARQAEKIEFDCCEEFSPALKAAGGLGRTTYARTIRDNFPGCDVVPGVPAGSFNYARLRTCDLDAESASHPAVFSYTFYGAVGYRFSDDCPHFVGLGGSYESASVNTTLHRWTIWAKAVAAF
jgi:hypothetical protein